MNVDTKTHEQNFSKWIVTINISDLFWEYKLYYLKQCDYLLQREYGIENIWLSQKIIKFIWLSFLKRHSTLDMEISLVF